MKKIPADNVFVDLEGTITDDVTANEFIGDPDLKGDSFGGILRRMLSEKFKISGSEALDIIRKTTAPRGWIDPFYAISHSNWGISENEMWTEILKWQESHLLIYSDAVDMIRNLHGRNFNLYMVSNCARTVVLSQLNTAKLADRGHSTYFKRIYGCFDLGFQKNNPMVYKEIVKRESVDPGKTIMVGNEPGIDLESPGRAGIAYSVIVDRNQPEAIKISGRGIFVNSLQVVPGILELS